MTRGVFFLASAIVIAIISFVSIRPALAQSPQASEVFVEEVEIRGDRRIPRESVLYYVQSKPQDKFDLSLAQRDLQSIIQIGQLGLFDSLSTKLFVEDGPRGGKIIIFQGKEYPIIRDLQYRGMKSATESEVLTRFKEKRVQVGKESQFDPAKANGARLILQEPPAEMERPEANVSVEVEEISATTVGLVFEKLRALAMRFNADHIRAYGAPPPVRRGDTRSLSFIGGIPIFERFFLGGEYDIRGYDVRSITPAVVSDVRHSNRGGITAQKPDPSDPTKPIEITNPNELRKFSFQAPEGGRAPDSR